MSQSQHDTTKEADIALLEIKTFFLKKGTVIKNKEDLINKGLETCARLLNNLDEETLDAVL